MVTPGGPTAHSNQLRAMLTIKGGMEGETKREDEELCIICIEKRVAYACIPCGHLKYCESCIDIIVKRNECAVCRATVQSVYKIFI